MPLHSNRRALRSARSFRTLALSLAIVTAMPSTPHAQSRRDSTVVGPGLTVPAYATGASRAVIDSNDVRSSSATTLSELLQARAASVDVMMSGGTLTDGGRVLIRGPSSISTGGAPLLIVDGIRVADRQDDSTGTASRLDDIGLDDIATEEVLRGPAAAALFGGGAPSGVIVVTTKRGAARGWHVDGRAFADARRVTPHFPLNYDGVGLFPNFATPRSGCTLVGVATAQCTRTSLVVTDPLSDASPLRTGTGGRASLGVSHGTSTGAMRVSVAGRQANGIAPDDRLSQLFTRLNATQRLTRGLDVGAHASWLTGTSQRSSLGEVIMSGLGRSSSADTRTKFTDDVAYAYAHPPDEDQQHVTLGGEVAWRPLTWLVVRGALTRDHDEANASRTLDATSLWFAFNVPYAFRIDRREGTIRTSRASAELTHRVPGMPQASGRFVIGTERTVRFREHSDSVSGPGFVRTSWSLARGVNNAAFFSERITVGERFVLGAGVRQERDTRADTAFRFYPSADAAWLTPWAPAGGNLRVRAAYGEAAQPFSMFDFFVPPIPFPVIPGLKPASKTPELVRELEGGVDLEWSRRASIGTTIYWRRASDVLTWLPNQLFGGATAYTRNIDTRGVEIDARAAVLERGGWRWELRAIAAALRNRAEGDYKLFGPGYAVVQEGSPVYGVSGSEPTFADKNGDGLLTYQEVTARQPEADLRPSTPTFQGALHSTVAWGSHLTVLAIVDRHSGQYAVPGSEWIHCAQPNCREAQDPGSTLAEQAHALELQTGRVFSDASFTRLREVSIRWVLMSAAGGSRGATLVVAGRDLATWTGWKGLDPEINTNRRIALVQSDLGGVPLPRRVSVGVEIGAGTR